MICRYRRALLCCLSWVLFVVTVGDVHSMTDSYRATSTNVGVESPTFHQVGCHQTALLPMPMTTNDMNSKTTTITTRKERRHDHCDDVVNRWWRRRNFDGIWFLLWILDSASHRFTKTAVEMSLNRRESYTQPTRRKWSSIEVGLTNPFSCRFMVVIMAYFSLRYMLMTWGFRTSSFWSPCLQSL